MTIHAAVCAGRCGNHEKRAARQPAPGRAMPTRPPPAMPAQMASSNRRRAD